MMARSFGRSAPCGRVPLALGHGRSSGLGNGSAPDLSRCRGGTGTQLWAKRYDGPANSADDAYALEMSPDGAEVFVTGSGTGSTTGRNYVANALGVSPDGAEVFVTGRSTGSGGKGNATLAYDVT